MDIKIIFSSKGRFDKNKEQKIADDDTSSSAKLIADALIKKGHKIEIMKIIPEKVSVINNLKADAVFNLCEWSGKDYPLSVHVLKTLEQKNIPYTGADSKSYEWCCNKFLMKKMFDKFNLLTPNWVSIDPGDGIYKIYSKLTGLTFPIIAKPAYEHCTIGINKKSVIYNRRGAVNKILKLLNHYKEPVLVEEFIKGREFTITLLKNHSLHVFPPAEIIFNEGGSYGFISFDSQWVSKTDEYISKIVLDKKLAADLKSFARRIFRKMGCRGYARIDIRYRAGKIYVLEINVNPGLAPYKNYGLTVSTEAAGWTFEKLVNEIIQSATRYQF